MEAVPKVPMLHFTLKQTLQKSSFSRLKQYIAECYQEDPETFSKEIYELETLRAAAYNPSIDDTGYNVIKRYYCQLHSLQNRFPIENDRSLVNFVWRDIYSSNTTQSSDIRHDMAVVLYNYGAIHTQVGAAANRSSEEEMKLVCTLFQRAAWAFETIREKYQMATTGDMYPEILIFMQNICFAQAQECILEKSLIDNRKSIIVAKVASQIIEYYNSAFAALLSGGEEGMIAEIVGSRQFKEWRQYIQFKVQYTACILLLYQGQNAEEQQKMGERVTLYQASFDRLEDARKEAKHLNNMTQVTEALTFVMDVVEAKRKAAKNENEFIYHEEVPELSSIATIAGANLVKGIPFNVSDAASEDIFHRLVPIKTHEHSSLYSEEKTNLLRKITQKIEAKDNELNQFMESLNIDSLSFNPKEVKLPQSIIDRCAAMNARPTVIDDLIQNMSSLAEICVDVENMLQTIQELLSKEEFYEKDFQQTMGQYRPSGHFVELSREFMKYQEAHNKAGDSNDTLRKAMEMHVNNLRILSKPLSDVQAAIPTCSIECDPKLLSETQMLLNKVNEMRVQRAQLYAQLSENIQNDDITAQLVAWGDEDVEKLFKSELGKHEQLINIIEQNLVAQENILKTFTDAYAKCAHFIKTVSDTKHKRDIFFSSLIASYDVYDDLLGKSLKGLEFYKKLQSNIQRLCARVRSARDVHDEERQQRIDSMNKKALSSMQPPSSMPVSTALAPNADYPKLTKPTEHDVMESYRSTAIRPTPIGQENCLTSMQHDVSHSNSVSTTVPFNYNYQTSVAASMPSSYTPPAAQTTISTPSSAPSSYSNQSNTYSSQQSAYSSQPNSYSSQQNAYYATQFSQANAAYAPNSAGGFVNPIYSNLPTSNAAQQPKQSYENVPTTVTYTTSGSTSVSSYGNVGTYSYATTSPTSTQQYNYNSMMTSVQNPVQNLPVSSQSQSYLNYSQSDTRQANSYMNPSYATAQTPTTATYYSQTPQTSVYQSANASSITNPTLQSYAGVSYADYTSQVNAYEMPSNSQYSQQSQQVPQAYSHSNSTASYMQTTAHPQPQQQSHVPQVSSSTAFTNYTPGYSTQSLPQASGASTTGQLSQIGVTAGLPQIGATTGQLPQTGVSSGQFPQTLPPTTATITNNPQSTYPTSDAYNYYNTQYPVHNTPTSNKYYGNETNIQSNPYSMPMSSSYLPPGYGVPANYSAPNQTNVYNYGTIDPAASGSLASAGSNYTTISQHAPNIAPASANAMTPATNPVVQSSISAQVSYPPHASIPASSIPASVAPYQNVAPSSSVTTIPANSPQVKPEPAKPKSNKFDLLSDLDNISIAAPTLQPMKSTDKLLQPEPKPEIVTPNKPDESQTKKEEMIPELPRPTSDERPPVHKNDSIEKALTELSLAEEELTIKAKVETETKPAISSHLAELIASSTVVSTASVPPSSANIENFYKEVQRYEKIVNGLTTKTLNGTTPLEIKWKELHDLLDKDAAKRSVSVSKLFPEKNRNMLSVPYDHSRVLLPTETDNYINAAHIRDLGSHCNHFILADAPTYNTVKDFWCMIWSQNASYVVCLIIPDEGPILLFPKQLNTPHNFGDYTVTILSEHNRLHIIERSIRVTSSESNSTRIITILQPKQWPTKNSITNIIGVSQNIIDTATAAKLHNIPVILNCPTNLERSSLVALTITCILALECEMPIIINVTDVWYRICSQRKNILNDTSIFQQSMQIVLQCCREFIKKRSPKTLSNNTQTNYYFIEEEEPTVKDPFKDLDPLWKLK
ncbi:tyrosine-protein phosphatase non-receptor type 23 [Sitodiplosis mosellana]|uniref:tyrosine-protein phosphatase non-receptor type 23 n=1 Tax=Sitodiplosis mosellana TaxID=263140 RepID=UPI0024449C47|nr:tyrosine-protein phosphatase non-receptor type 23 [Sitodiplosis mosellana]XP_055314079.1 tyrosine-protein phosphatase non-receptor type 23 [Sitodiplosis mosellana]